MEQKLGQESTGWVRSAKPICRQVARHSELSFCSGEGRKGDFSWCRCPDKRVGWSEVEGWDGAIGDWIYRMGSSRLEPNSKGKRNPVLLPAKPWHSSCLLLTHIQVLIYSTSSRGAGLNISPWSLQAACFCAHPSAHQGLLPGLSSLFPHLPLCNLGKDTKESGPDPQT